jgi:SAM-dependent methyltransferase
VIPPPAHGQPTWLDARQPHEEAHSRAQIAGLLELMAPAPKRVIDLGCGAGRVLVPLAEAGHDVYGIDRDRRAIDDCRCALRETGAEARLLEADFTSADPWRGEPVELVCCLGNTLMTIAEVDDAITLLRRVLGWLAPDGIIVVDDIPTDLWPELTEGNWQSGLSPDGDAQLVWDPSDAVFTLRTGDAVDESSWAIRSDEPRYRLWTDGALRLVARLAGLSDPERCPASHLLIIRRDRGATTGD